MALTQHLMRRGHNKRPASTDAISLTIGSIHDTPFDTRRLDQDVFPSVVDRAKLLQSDTICLYHPSARQYLQSPLAIAPLSPAHSLFLIENRYLTGFHSAKDPNVRTYTICMYLTHETYYKDTIKTIITRQLTNMQTDELLASTVELEVLRVS
jgi:hypothetical protein